MQVILVYLFLEPLNKLLPKYEYFIILMITIDPLCKIFFVDYPATHVVLVEIFAAVKLLFCDMAMVSVISKTGTFYLAEV